MAIERRIMCDTNTLLDIFDVERAHHIDALALLWYGADNAGKTELVAPVTSFKDAYCVLRRLYKNEAQARASIDSIMGKFVKPLDMLANYGAEALASDEPDFEDGMVRMCAEHEGATVIVTRDKKVFETSAVPALSAEEFLVRVGFDYELIEW